MFAFVTACKIPPAHVEVYEDLHYLTMNSRGTVCIFHRRLVTNRSANRA